jgi:peptide-methionine (S)-S-oxide reductase
VVQITYDPNLVTYQDLLNVFFTIHDPTTPNRQGNDVGPQYRSIIVYHDEEQKAAAEEAIKKVDSEQWFGSKGVVTELVPLADNKYWPGEQYHQNYYKNNPAQGYCSFVVGPKVQKFRAKFMKQLQA